MDVLRQNPVAVVVREGQEIESVEDECDEGKEEEGEHDNCGCGEFLARTVKYKAVIMEVMKVSGAVIRSVLCK